MFSRIIPVVLGIVSASFPCWAAVRAVITNCCSGSGTVVEIDAATFRARSVSTDVISVGTFSQAGPFALMKDGRHAVVVNSQTVAFNESVPVLTILDLKTGVAAVQSTIPASHANGYPLLINPSTGTIYLGYSDIDFQSHIQIIDPSNLAVLEDVNFGDVGWYSILISPDGERLYAETTALTTYVLNTSDLSVVATCSVCNGTLALSPDGKTLYNAIGGAISLIDTATLQVTDAIPFSLVVEGAGFSPSGSQLYLTTQDQEVCTLTVGTLALACVSVAVPAFQVSVSSNGTVYLNSSTVQSVTAQVSIFDPITQTIAATHAIPAPGTIAPTPDGKYIYLLPPTPSQISTTAQVPSTTLLRFATVSRVGGGGAYDEIDDLLILDNGFGQIQVFDPATLESEGFVNLPGSFFVGFHGSGFAVTTGQPSPTGPKSGIVRFDPVALTTTGFVNIPCTGIEFANWAMTGKTLYATFIALPNEPGACSGMAVVDTEQMTLKAILPIPASLYPNYFSAFAIPQHDSKVGYSFEAFEGGESVLIEIDLTTSRILRALHIAPTYTFLASLAFSPDGKTIYALQDTRNQYDMGATLYAIDAATLTISNSALFNIYGSLSVSPDGQYIYCSNDSGGEAIISTSTLQQIDTVPSTIIAGSVVFAGK